MVYVCLYIYNRQKSVRTVRHRFVLTWKIKRYPCSLILYSSLKIKKKILKIESQKTVGVKQEKIYKSNRHMISA